MRVSQGKELRNWTRNFTTQRIKGQCQTKESSVIGQEFYYSEDKETVSQEIAP